MVPPEISLNYTLECKIPRKSNAKSAWIRTFYSCHIPSDAVIPELDMGQCHFNWHKPTRPYGSLRLLFTYINLYTGKKLYRFSRSFWEILFHSNSTLM